MPTDLRYLQVDYSTPPVDGDMMRYESSSGLWLPDTYTYPTLVDLTTGWVDYDVSDLSYSSAFEITGLGSGSQIPVRKGSRITWVQASTQKFGLVTSGLNNSLTIAENDDYEFSNNAITNFQYSLMPIPYKNLEDFNIYFPQSFNFTPTVAKISGAGTLASSTVNHFKFSVDEMWVKVSLDILLDIDTDVITGVSITLPISCAGEDQYPAGFSLFENATTEHPLRGALPSGTSTMSIQKYQNPSATFVVNTNNTRIAGDFRYRY